MRRNKFGRSVLGLFACLLLAFCLPALSMADGREIDVGSKAELEQAINQANGPTTIRLTGDVRTSVTVIIIPEGKDITLKLDGNNLVGTGTYVIRTYGKLTLTGPGTVENAAGMALTSVQNEGGECTIQGATLLGGSTTLVNNGGVMRISNTTVTASMMAAIANQLDGTLYIEDGCVVQDESFCGIHNASTVYFNGGVFRSKGTPIYDNGGTAVYPEGMYIQDSTDGDYKVSSLAPAVVSGKVNGSAGYFGGGSLEGLLKAAGVTKPANLRQLTVTKGTVTADDWAYLSANGAGLQTLQVDSTVSAVADIPAQFMRGSSALRQVSIAHARRVGQAALSNCGALQSVSFPQVEAMEADVLSGSPKLTRLGLPAQPPTFAGPALVTDAPCWVIPLDGTGRPLTGDPLRVALQSYRQANDDQTGDSLWYQLMLEDISFRITVTAGPGGKIDGPATVLLGENAVYTVRPDEGYTVDTVTVDGVSAQLSGGTYTFGSVQADHSLRVTFRLRSGASFPVDDGNGGGAVLGPKEDASEGTALRPADGDTQAAGTADDALPNTGLAPSFGKYSLTVLVLAAVGAGLYALNRKK